MVSGCMFIMMARFCRALASSCFYHSDRMSPHKPKDEDEEDTSNVNEFHGHPLLVKTDMTEEMAYDVSI